MLQNFNDNPFLFLADLRHAVKRLIALKFGHSRSTVHHLRLIRINFQTLMSIIFSSFQRQKTWEEMCGIYIYPKMRLMAQGKKRAIDGNTRCSVIFQSPFMTNQAINDKTGRTDRYLVSIKKE